MPDNLYKRGGTWYLRIQSGRREHRRSLQTGSRVEAKARRDKIVADLRHEKFHGEARHTWQAAALKWAEEYLPGIAPGTAKRYRVSARKFYEVFANLHVDEIDRKQVLKVATRAGVSNATRRRDLTALSSILHCCMQWQWVETNAARALDRSIIPERRDPVRIPDDKEVATLTAACPPGLARMVQFLALTGCREEEAAGLERTQVDARRGEVTFLRTKTNRPRTIALASPVRPGWTGTGVVTALHMTEPFVFWHGRGDRYRNVASRLAEIIGELAENKKLAHFRVHDLRHRFAVRWLQAGGDIYALSRHLGHSSVKTTEGYLRYLSQAPAQNTAHPATVRHRGKSAIAARKVRAVK